MPAAKRRGPHPQDRLLFAPSAIPALRQAVADLSWLRTRGYPENSAIQLVGDRYQLAARQRSAVSRSACSDPGLHDRRNRMFHVEHCRNRELAIDGFNLLITLEAALAGGVILEGRDGCLRDLSSLHGNYHVLADTRQAVRLTCQFLAGIAPSKVVWYLDQPVSNSGRLAALIRELAGEFPALGTGVHLVPDPDRVLSEQPPGAAIVVSSDSLILAGTVSWLNLARHVIAESIPQAPILHLGAEPGPS